jgi:hypothetical protein
MRKRLDAYQPDARIPSALDSHIPLRTKPRLSQMQIAAIKALIKSGASDQLIVQTVRCSPGSVYHYRHVHREERKERQHQNQPGLHVVRLCNLDGCHETAEKDGLYCAEHKSVPGRAAVQTSTFIPALPMARLMAGR